jgi:magnesium chelatase family protein
MFASIASTALLGVESQHVLVEVHAVGSIKPAFSIVGLPDTAVREARERVLSALASSNFELPTSRITVNLSPADLPKAGSAYDLPIALGTLIATGAIGKEAAGVVALGELALDGTLRAVRGGVGAAIVARDLGLPCVLAPDAAGEAHRVGGSDVRGASNLREAVDVALGHVPGAPPVSSLEFEASPGPDLSSVRGQPVARRALEIAAAGGHHLLMFGPPGSGKTLLAATLPSILPPLTDEESLEVSLVWGAAGLRRGGSGRPPFRSPHHTATVAALVGGGSGLPSPGEVSAAHRGVLFLDELGEVPPRLLEALRQPLEDGTVTVSRRGYSVTFPAAFQLVAATNPCPCGFRDDRIAGCGCTGAALDRYRSRFSGPLLDRIDVRVRVSRLDADALAAPPGEASGSVAERVNVARLRQRQRGCLNRFLGRDDLDSLRYSREASYLLRMAVDRFSLTGRGWDRVRRVARTVADLAGSDVVDEAAVGEALAFRDEP